MTAFEAVDNTKPYSYDQEWEALVHQGITDIELCHKVRLERRFHAKAWRLLVEREAVLEHFKLIARTSLLYQPLAYAHILKNFKDKDDLLFVTTRQNEQAFNAAKRLVSQYKLTNEEMHDVLRALSEPQKIELFCLILLHQRKHLRQLEMCVPNLYEHYRERLRSRGIPIGNIGERGLRVELQQQARLGKFPLKAARRLIRFAPTRENFLLVFKELESKKTETLLRNIATKCMSNRGIDWKKVCVFLPDHPSPVVKECVEALIAIHNRTTALRTLLAHSHEFRRYAAGTILNNSAVVTSDLTLILIHAPHRYRKRAALILIHRKLVRSADLALAWQRVGELRPQVEKVIRQRGIDAKMKECLSMHAPQLLERLCVQPVHIP